MSYNLENGVAVITGAGSGIGQATAILFAEYGCESLVLGDLNVAGLETTRDSIVKANPGASVETVKVDIREEASVDAFYDHAISRFGRIDFAANIAGVIHEPKPTADISSEDFERVFSVNLRGTWLCERALLSRMVKQDTLKGFPLLRGSICNVTSTLATMALPGQAGYSGSKGGVLAITRTDALDYGKHGIRVNAVAPGMTHTPLIAGFMSADVQKLVEGYCPLGRLAQARDIANAIVWLSSPNAGYVNGVSLPVDGGFWHRSGP